MVGGWEIGRELALLARQVRLDRKIRSEQQAVRNVKWPPYGGHLRVLKRKSMVSSGTHHTFHPMQKMAFRLNLAPRPGDFCYP